MRQRLSPNIGYAYGIISLNLHKFSSIWNEKSFILPTSCFQKQRPLYCKQGKPANKEQYSGRIIYEFFKHVPVRFCKWVDKWRTRYLYHLKGTLMHQEPWQSINNMSSTSILSPTRIWFVFSVGWDEVTRAFKFFYI